MDDLERDAIDRNIADEGYALGREAYRQIKGLSGGTVHLGVKKPEGAGGYGDLRKRFRPTRRRKVDRPIGSGETTAGAIFVGGE